MVWQCLTPLPLAYLAFIAFSIRACPRSWVTQSLITALAPAELFAGGDTSNHDMSKPKQIMKLRSNDQENRQPSIRDNCRDSSGDTLMVVSNCRRMAVSGEWLLFVPLCFVQCRDTLMVVSDSGEWLQFVPFCFVQCRDTFIVLSGCFRNAREPRNPTPTSRNMPEARMPGRFVYSNLCFSQNTKAGDKAGF